MLIRVFARRFVIATALLMSALLAGCFESSEPLFPNDGVGAGMLAARYTITDGSAPLGDLRLSEDNGIYTVVASSDESATAEIAVGRSFSLHPVQLSGHSLEDTFGPFEYFWVQSPKVDLPGFDYDLIGVSARPERFVFRWSGWTMTGNEGFLDALLALGDTHPDLIACNTGSNFTCALTDAGVLDLIGELVVLHDLSPIRALVPR